MSSQRTVRGTTERISGMRDLGGGEMLSKLAVDVGLGLRFALVLLVLSIEGENGANSQCAGYGSRVHSCLGRLRLGLR